MRWYGCHLIEKWNESEKKVKKTATQDNQLHYQHARESACLV